MPSASATNLSGARGNGAVGFGLAVESLYIAKISPAIYRGELVTWSEMALNVGIVLGFSAGLIFYNLEDSLEWRLMFLMGAILPVVMIILVRTVMPESPRWLVDNGREEEAKAILQQVYPPGKIAPRFGFMGLAFPTCIEH
jgi:MFS family permease